MAPKDFDPQFSPTLSLDVLTVTYAKTGTGLDYIVDQVLTDPGLNVRAPDDDVRAGAIAAAGMNTIIVEAVRATGVANDGKLAAADVHILSDWINKNRLDAWKKLHGDDEKNVETGFHKVQGDGGSLHVYGDALVNQVADGIYHLGFGTKGDRLKDEDGQPNARAEKIAFWLNDILADDLKAGGLTNASVTPMVQGTTGTGLDDLVDVITSDAGLDRRISAQEINKGAKAADAMNKIIVDGIKALGLGDDKILTTAEVYDLSDWISANRYSQWKTAHGNDESGVETGFHLVQGDGAETRMEGRSAIDSIADSIYHLGFGYKWGHLINEDGDGNQSVEKVTEWLNTILSNDLASGALASGQANAQMGSTGTGLDQLTNLIVNEAELNRRLPLAEIEKGAAAADAMNKIVVDGIKALGLLNNGELNVADMKDLSDWISKNHKAAWKSAHGNDEKNVETGFHLVQGDGAVTRGYGKNMVDTVADGIYHLGFGYKWNHLINEDGDGNAALSQVAHWMNELLAGDISSGALKNSSVDPYPTGTTGTALDQVVDLLVTDPGLARSFKTSELAQVARDTDGLNKILIDAIKSTGVANDGNINDLDIRVVGDWIKDNALGRWSALRGDDDDDSGLMGLIWMGAASEIAGVNTVNQFSALIYSLGYNQKWGGVINEDGDWMGRAEDASAWLNSILATELSDGSLSNSGLVNSPSSAIASDVVLEAATVSVTDDDNYEIYAHSSALKLNEGTIAFTFVAEDPDSQRTQVMFSKDAMGTNNGDTRVYFYDGKIYAKFSYRGQDSYVEVPHSVKAGEAHDFAMTFSNSAVSFWLDGVQVEYRSDLGLTWAQNAKDIVVGASNGHQDANNPDKIVNEFQGEITGFQIYDRVLDRGEIEGLSGGLTVVGDGANNNLAGSDGQDAMHGGLGRDVLVAGDGDDAVNGGYGADLLKGGKGDDFLDGGHGQDKLEGGDGDDILLSTSDGREQTPGQLLPGYSKPKKIRPDDGSLDQASQKLYPDQPIAADDVMTGGAGADTFRFQFMINAKYDIIMKHARDDGSINWRGVAGENTYVHDHWVDMIGDDVITDFDRSEGDKIEIAGHTLTIENLTYHDSNNDGVNDYSKISFISKQGNGGGAHDEDALGSVTVYGDLVKMSDISQIPSNTVFYGIVENISDIDEAITPMSVDNGTARSDPGLNAASASGPRGQADTSGGTATTGNNVVAASRSGTGLDQILDWIETDQGLLTRITDAEISEGSKAAAEMNKIVLEAVKATGAANDGKIDAGDVYAVSDWIKANRKAEWVKQHGNDEKNVETAFHLVQNDGAVENAYGRNSVNTVADAIYHLGFGYKNGRLINEDGDGNERVETVAYWLDSLLKDDLGAGALANGGVSTTVTGSTGTGLDTLVDIISNDSELERRLPNSEQNAGAQAADDMNKIIVDSIKALGLANDGKFTASDVMALVDHIKANHLSAWRTAHGDDEATSETGFHKVQGDGAKTRLYADNAVNTVADGIYHLGFGHKHGHLINEDGDLNANTAIVAEWLNKLLAGDMAALSNSSVDPTPSGTTGTGLDQLVEAINTDTGLNLMVSLRDIQRGADAANTMNQIIVDSIKATGVGNNGQITVSDVMVLSDYIKAKHYNAWKQAHGDDEKNVETGFHLVQGDGAQGRSYAQNTVNTVADGIYHLGFGFRNGAVINEDGQGNASLSDVAGWLNELLRDDLASGTLNNASNNPYVQGTTGTGLDAMVDMITKDVGLSNSLKTTDISKAATAADKMGEILIEAIKATGVANDGKITSLDLVDLDAWIGDNYGAELKAQNARFEVAEVWAATSPLFGKDGINDVADAIYSIGFGTKWGNALLDVNGNWAGQLSDAADWLGKVLDGELKSGALYSASNGYTDPSNFASDLVMAAGRVQANGIDGYADIDHSGALSLKQGTVAFDMKANSLPQKGTVTFFTKDARDKGDGHTKIYISDGELYLRMQTATQNHYLKAEMGALKAGTDYHIALVFGSAGLKLFVDGEKVLSRPDLTIDWSRNSEGVVLGASGDWRNPSNPTHVYDIFDGTISNAAIYDRALNLGEIAGLNGVNTDVQPSGVPSNPITVTPPPVEDTTPEVVVEDTTPVVDETPSTSPTPPQTTPVGDQKLVGNASANQLTGDSGNDRLIALSGDDTLDGAAGNDLLNTGSGDDLARGGDGRDRLLGLGGDDTLEGGAGDDTIFGSDGDDLIAGDAGNDRIDGGAGNDTMTGGSGKDSFVIAHQASNDGDVDRITDADLSEDVLIIRAFAGNRQFAISSQEDLFNLSLTGLTVTSTGSDTRLSFDDGNSSSDVILSGISDPLG